MPGSVTLRGAATLLVVRDVLQAVAHYRDVLGFRVEFTGPWPPYHFTRERTDVR